TKTIADLADQSFFLIRTRPLTLDAAAEKAMKEDVMLRLRRLKPVLGGVSPWEAPVIAEAIQAFVRDEGIGMGQIGPGLRAVVTGGAPAPDLAQTLALLGKDEAMARFGDRV
ncbi:MAG: glutamate--tRNA ligase, partial [Pseudomonadota bacterium]